MQETVRLQLEPAGRSLVIPTGASPRDELFAAGVEFPCGGRGRCRGCRVRLLAGEAPPTLDDTLRFSEAELAEGWRLACRLRPEEDTTLELAQWESPILADESRFAFTPRPGTGVAIDLGTTTLVAQRVDLATGHVLGVRSGLNSQAQHGADLMSRLDFAARSDGARRLGDLIRRQLGLLLRDLLAPADAAASVREIVLVGNTVMHHLFAGLPTETLARHPFEPADPEARAFAPRDLGWAELVPGLASDVTVHFLPCLGSFVGSDLLAGLLATRLHESETPGALVDLGTNGEIIVGNRDRLLCASTAAGPAFEGARIMHGMRAATGAVSEVYLADDALRAHVIGGGMPRGICGSGLVDAVAGGLELGLIQPTGRLLGGEALCIAPPVEVCQCDIRELQLAKGAIAAGLRVLAGEWGTTMDQLGTIHLAGAFGNYLNLDSARRIGLLPFPLDRIRPAGNTALHGAKLALFRPPGSDLAFRDLRSKMRHVSLNDASDFMDVYVQEMSFPAARLPR